MLKTVLITGASRGIGAETAVIFAENGFQVAVNYCSNREMAEKLVENLIENGCRAIAVGADVSNRNEVDVMIETVSQQLGPIDVLVNNAGIAQQGLFTDITESQWKQMFAVNVDGVFHCCQAVLPQMIRRKSGKIVNVSSIWGICGASCEVPYSASKAAVIGFTKALAKEVGPSGIQVNCVAPGVIATDMNASLSEQTVRELCELTPLGCIGTVRDVAQAVWFLSGPQSDFITGQVLSPNGGMVI